MNVKVFKRAGGCHFFVFFALAFNSSGFGQVFNSFDFYQRDVIDSPVGIERSDLEDGINLAECEANTVFTFRYTYSGSLSAGDLEVWIGASCDDKTVRDEGRCLHVVDGGTVDTSGYLDIESKWIVGYQSEEPECTEDEGSANVYMWIAANDADRTIISNIAAASISYDTAPPSAPINVKASYGEGKVRISWEVANENKPDDWQYFAVLCYTDYAPPASDESEAKEGSGTGGAEPIDGVSDGDVDVVDVRADDGDVQQEDAYEDLPSEELNEVSGQDSTAEDIGGNDEGYSYDTSSETSPSGQCPSGGFGEGDEYAPSYLCSEILGSSSRSYLITGLHNGVKYKFAVVAFDRFANPSPVSSIVCATPEEVDDFWEVYKKSGGRAGGEFCFIATAAYGSYIHPCVGVLREFRDRILNKTSAGRKLVYLYYSTSPPVARLISKSSVLKMVVRVGLLPLVGLSWTALKVIDHYGVILILLVVLIFTIALARSFKSLLGSSGVDRRGFY